jgi:uncharacterized protein (TIGR02266 family)
MQAKLEKEDEGNLKREQFRIPIEFLIEYKKSSISFDDFCRNLSTGGVFIATRNFFPIGTQLDIAFTLPHNHETFVTSGKVVWIRDIDEEGDPGMGIMFKDFDEKQRSGIEDAIQFYKKIVNQY